MAPITTEIATYQIRHFSTRKYTEGPTITLYGANGRLVGTITFFADSVELPAASMAPPAGGPNATFRLYFGRSAFPELVELLRTEKPVRLVYQPEGVNNSCLETGIEPTGEGVG